MKILRAGLLAGLASALLIAAPAAHAQDNQQSAQIDAALDPLMRNVPTQDVLGVRLGMGWPEARDILIGKGFDVQSPRRLSVTRSGKGMMRYKVIRKGGRSLPASEEIILYFSGSTNPRLMALYRETNYKYGQEVIFDNLRLAMNDRYGPPGRQRELSGSTFIHEWGAPGLPNTCRADWLDLSELKFGNAGDDYKGCFRGLAIFVEPWVKQSRWPVRRTWTFLVDARLIDANRDVLLRRGAEQARERAQEEDERKRNSTSVEL